MTVAKFTEVLDGFEFGAFGAMPTNQAFISLERGTVHFVSSELEEDAPEDLDSGDYLALPDKAVLGLGRELVMEFAREQLPDDVDTVWGFSASAARTGVSRIFWSAGVGFRPGMTMRALPPRRACARGVPSMALSLCKLGRQRWGGGSGDFYYCIYSCLPFIHER